MNTKTTGLLVLALVVILGVGYFAFSGTESKKINIKSATEEVREVKNNYKDGVYTQVGAYKSPAGLEEIEVKITLKNGVVTDSEVTAKAENPISKAKQTGFVKEYKTSVVGKNIKDLQLGKVAGASLTPKGFNDAVTKIMKAAQS